MEVFGGKMDCTMSFLFRFLFETLDILTFGMSNDKGENVLNVPLVHFTENVFPIFLLITLSLAESLSGFLPPSAPQRLL